jgi:hypothetical protein
MLEKQKKFSPARTVKLNCLVHCGVYIVFVLTLITSMQLEIRTELVTHAAKWTG